MSVYPISNNQWKDENRCLAHLKKKKWDIGMIVIDATFIIVYIAITSTQISKFQNRGKYYYDDPIVVSMFRPNFNPSSLSECEIFSNSIPYYPKTAEVTGQEAADFANNINDSLVNLAMILQIICVIATTLIKSILDYKKILNFYQKKCFLGICVFVSFSFSALTYPIVTVNYDWCLSGSGIRKLGNLNTYYLSFYGFCFIVIIFLLNAYPKALQYVSAVVLCIFFTEIEYRDKDGYRQTFNLAVLFYIIVAFIIVCILMFLGVSLYLLIELPEISIRVFTGLKLFRVAIVGIHDIFFWVRQ